MKIISTAAFLAAVVVQTATAEIEPTLATREAVQEARTASKISDVIARQAVVTDGFDAFKAKVFKEPFDGGLYIVNGDTPILNEQELREFYQKEIDAGWNSSRFGLPLMAAAPALVGDAPNGQLISWSSTAKRNLTYCVGKDFKSDHDRVSKAMRDASNAWEEVSDVRFVHLTTQDSDCNAGNANVVFDVRPVNVGGEYLARAFFPRYPRENRNVLIDRSALTLAPGNLTLTGVLRHELGHVLSFRHEQTRPEAGRCFEDDGWVPLTSYDAFSVMHYPQCNGLGDWSLSLTEKDKVGAACLYGGAEGTTFDSSKCI